MNEQEFAYWQTRMENCRFQWVENKTYHLNGHGVMFYTDGMDGYYMEIRKDGLLTVGTYEGAIPLIGEAIFTSEAGKQLKDFDEAFMTAALLAGSQFLEDLFSGHPAVDDIWPGERSTVMEGRKAAPLLGQGGGNLKR